MANNAFEKGILNTVKEILSQRKDLDIVYNHNGSKDPYFTHTLKDGDAEILHLQYAIHDMGGKSTLRIKGRTQEWSPEAIEELHKMLDNAWWAKERAKDAAKDQAKTDKVKKEQEEISSYLSGFLSNGK